ncbi:MAG: GNAT family N-acetyltransferase [Acidobacteria bacterium]|nr:GNAT family N-acetyltransferase [Acidobacteriota bacterium]
MTLDTAAGDGVPSDIARRYPRRVELADGSQVELELMGNDDIDDILAFARTLPPNDLMFLRVNITERSTVRQWIDSIRAGRTITVLARQDGRMLGESTLLHNEANWTRHLGEIRIQISPDARRRGLARVLAREIDAIAKQVGLQLLTARMTLDQSAAQAVFRRLGFQREAVLWDYAITPDGDTQNVLVATKRL